MSEVLDVPNSDVELVYSTVRKTNSKFNDKANVVHLVIFNPAHQTILLIWQSSKFQLGLSEWQPLIDSFNGFIEVFCLLNHQNNCTCI